MHAGSSVATRCTVPVPMHQNRPCSHHGNSVLPDQACMHRLAYSAGPAGQSVARVEQTLHLRGEHGEGHERAEEAEGDPVRGKLADAKVAHDELQLIWQRQPGVPDVLGAAPPELNRATRPAVLLLPICEEAGRQLRDPPATRVCWELLGCGVLGDCCDVGLQSMLLRKEVRTLQGNLGSGKRTASAGFKEHASLRTTVSRR